MGEQMDLCPLARRQLDAVRASHEALVAHTEADEPVRAGLRAVLDALTAGLAGLTEDQLLATPTPDEWSMAEVLDHVAEHDGKYDEFRRLGADHYVEHGLEHALQLWRLRTQQDP
jgi:hypothetical protein